MYIATTVLVMALAQPQAPAVLATVAGQVVDAEGRPAAGVEVLLSGLGGHPGHGRCLRERSPIVKGGSGLTFPQKKIPGALSCPWRCGPTTRRRGWPGNRSRPRRCPPRGRCN